MATNAKARMKAAEDGEVHFVSPRECPRCGSALRYTSSNQCVPCTKARAQGDCDDIRATLKRAREQARG